VHWFAGRNRRRTIPTNSKKEKFVEIKKEAIIVYRNYVVVVVVSSKESPLHAAVNPLRAFQELERNGMEARFVKGQSKSVDKRQSLL